MKNIIVQGRFMKRILGRNILFALSLFTLSGCANLMTTHEPTTPPLPDSYLLTNPNADLTDALFDSSKWWEAFKSEELNAIEEKALASLYSENKRAGNFDLQIAFTRLDQSAATLWQTRTQFLPNISYRGSAGNSTSEKQSIEDGPIVRSESESYSGTLSLSYELDLWGKIAAQNQASGYRYQASYEDVLTSVLSISSSIANNYIDLLSTRSSLDILHKQVELNETLVDLQKNRYANGQSTSLDVLQQQEQFIRSKSEEPILIERERALLASLALLTGELPTSTLEVNATSLPDMPPLPPTGIPADLIENRPDIRAAKYRLMAADKDLAIAQLAYLPDFNLSVSHALSSAAFSLLLNNWTTQLLASVSGIIFDAGANIAEANQKDAAAQELAITYVKTVANALDEVNTALMAEQAQKLYLDNLYEQLKFEKAAEEEAQLSYLNGVDTFLRYITQLQSLQTLERSIVTEEAELLKLRVNLYKSLGITI